MILITGASGSVGREVVREMLKMGKEFRAMYRSNEEAAKASQGVKTVMADFADAGSLQSALRGVDQLFLVCSPVQELVALEGNVIEVGKKSGVKRIVLNSALGAGDYDKSFPSWHRKVEDKLKTSGMEFVILRPNGFMQNIVTYLAPSIRATGAFFDAMGDAKASYIDVRDVAAVAAATLTGADHSGKTYELNGPEALTQDEIARKITAKSGRAVSHVNIPREAHQKAMLELRMPEWQVKALIELQDYYVSGRATEVNGLVAQILGRPPRTVDEFLSEVAEEFREQKANAGA
jgi:uncharacterized protein YbjT (DUF2867 family)